MKNYLIVALIVIFISINSLSAADEPRSYQAINPVNSSILPHEQPGSISGDYKQAVQSETLPAAMKNWERFLQIHDTGEFEDSFHANHVRLAKYELMRIYYLIGETDKADKLIKELAQP